MATVETKLAPTQTLLTMLTRALDKALPHARQLTERGRGIDAYQVHCERLAYRATELRAVQDLLRYAEARLQHGQEDGVTTSMALAFTAEASQTFLAEAEANLHDYGFTESFVQETLQDPAVRQAIRAGVAEAFLRTNRRCVLETNGMNNLWLGDEMAEMARQSVRDFTRQEVEPIAPRKVQSPSEIWTGLGSLAPKKPRASPAPWRCGAKFSLSQALFC